MKAYHPWRRFLAGCVGAALPLGLAATAVAQDAAPVAAVAPAPQPDQQLPAAREEAAQRAPGQLPMPKDVPPALPMPRPVPGMPKLLPPAGLEPGEEGLPITLPVALKLANAKAWDIIIATQQLQVAVAELQQARVLWLPTLLTGVDYQYHSGPIQEVPGQIISTNRTSMYAGLAPVAIFAVTDAIFIPLSVKQQVRAQDANIQTARNDTLTDMSQVYFDLIQAQSDLAGILYVDQQAARMVTKAQALAPGLIPTVELARVRAAKANFEQVIETARNRWRDASAEVARVARLKPTVVLLPLESPQVQITLVPPAHRPDELIPFAIANRPELTFQEAEAEAARLRLRQEQWRPFLPTLVGRGGGTVPPDAMAIGTFGGGPGTDLNTFNQRADWDVGAYWELRNMGLGNVRLIRQRRAEYDVAVSQEFRVRDIVAREVTQAWADVRSARQRVDAVIREVQQAELSARQNLEALGEVKRVAGGINILVIRPLEVVAALQALESAYFDFNGVLADYNRAEFRLYRALGSPAQAIAGHNGLGGPSLLPEPPVPEGGKAAQEAKDAKKPDDNDAKKADDKGK